MIRNEREYREAVRRLQEEQVRLQDHRERLQGSGLSEEEIKRVLDPLRSFHAQLQEEVQSYERLKRGDIAEITNLHGLGRTLIALRIAKGLSQRALAERLGVDESQVSRDERNEYHNVTVARAARILDALDVQMRSAFDGPVVPPTNDPSSGRVAA
jgi:DNA-directed RNA polymerase specialized sigma subunit